MTDEDELNAIINNSEYFYLVIPVKNSLYNTNHVQDLNVLEHNYELIRSANPNTFVAFGNLRDLQKYKMIHGAVIDATLSLAPIKKNTIEKSEEKQKSTRFTDLDVGEE